MKTKMILGVVGAVHIVAVGSLVCLQGCRPSTTVGTGAMAEPPPVVMPPSVPVPTTSAPGPTTAAVSSGAVMPFTTTYVVTKGDSLSVIAKKFGVRTRDLIDINQIKDPNKIRIGQKILLPGSVDTTKPRKVRTASRAPKAGPNQYVVKKGDTLSHIAKRHGTTIRTLRDVNKLTSDMIRVNQVLSLPGGATATAAAPVASRPPPTVASRPTEPVEAATAPSEPEEVTSRPASTDAGLPPMPPVDEEDPEPVVEEAVATAPAAEEDGGGDFIVHVVGKDEDVFDVALRYTVLPDEVRRLNDLDGNELQEGQRLKIKVSGIPE